MRAGIVVSARRSDGGVVDVWIVLSFKIEEDLYVLHKFAFHVWFELLGIAVNLSIQIIKA